MTNPAATDNLHRELAPITPAAWVEIEEEARRTFRRHVAGRRVVDVPGGTAHLREARPLVDLRVPFTVRRAAVDDVERGAHDSDWQPVKDAAR